MNEPSSFKVISSLCQRIPSASGILSLRPQREDLDGSFLGARLQSNVRWYAAGQFVLGTEASRLPVKR